MKRMIIGDAETYLAAIPAEIKRTKDAHYAHRLEAVRFVLQGHSLYEIERVWRITRRKTTHNRYFYSLSELHSSLISQFQQRQFPNSFLKVLCANI